MLCFVINIRGRDLPQISAYVITNFFSCMQHESDPYVRCMQKQGLSFKWHTRKTFHGWYSSIVKGKCASFVKNILIPLSCFTNLIGKGTFEVCHSLIIIIHTAIHLHFGEYLIVLLIWQSWILSCQVQSPWRNLKNVVRCSTNTWA